LIFWAKVTKTEQSMIDALKEECIKFSDKIAFNLYHRFFLNYPEGFIMQVADNTAVSIHYTLTNDNGEVLDSSIGKDTLEYLHGSGNIISGLEKALFGKVAGDKLNVRIAAKDAYGEFANEMIQVIQRSMFEGIDTIEVGMQFHADVNYGTGVVTVTAIDGDNVTIDGNHPLAGQDLTFDVEIVSIRPATAEEKAHGHIHGEGCHH
jgi:FKBP-type peptidyl-prolyl cis-trans isomerase SlyD